MWLLPSYWVPGTLIRSDLDQEYPWESNPDTDPKKIISDPQHWLCCIGAVRLKTCFSCRRMLAGCWIKRAESFQRSFAPLILAKFHHGEQAAQQAQVCRRVSDPDPAVSQALYPKADSAGSGTGMYGRWMGFRFSWITSIVSECGFCRLRLGSGSSCITSIVTECGFSKLRYVDGSLIRIQLYHKHCIRRRILQAQVCMVDEWDSDPAGSKALYPNVDSAGSGLDPDPAVSLAL